LIIATKKRKLVIEEMQDSPDIDRRLRLATSAEWAVEKWCRAGDVGVDRGMVELDLKQYFQVITRARN